MLRPHLEYGNIIWGPHYKGDQVIVEKVQKRATKLVSSIWHLPYKQRLKALNLPSPRQSDMLETDQVVTNKANVDKSHFFEFSFVPTQIKKTEVTKTCKNPKLLTEGSYQLELYAERSCASKDAYEFNAGIDEHWKDKQYVTPFDLSCVYN